MTIDRQTARLLQELNSQEVVPDSPIDISTAREGAYALFTGFAGPDMPGCATRDLQMAGPAGKIPVRLYTPLGAAEGGRPTVVFFHGGGWSLGNVAAYDGLVRALCCLSGVNFLSVDYRLAPEHPYPAAFEDCLAVTREMLDHGEKIGCDTARVAVMGDSAGGTLAAAVAGRIHSRSSLRLKAQFLLYPVLDISRPHEYYASRMTWGNGDYLLSREGIDRAADWYVPDRALRSRPEISPLRQAKPEIMPPTVLVVGEYDPLHDETMAYARKLAAAGVPCEVKVFEGAIHAFLSFGILDQAWAGRRYLADRLRAFLDGSVASARRI